MPSNAAENFISKTEASRNSRARLGAYVLWRPWCSLKIIFAYLTFAWSIFSANTLSYAQENRVACSKNSH